MSRRTLALALGLVVPLAVLERPAGAQAPAALVLETSGGSTPALPPYTEIPGGTIVSLPGTTRLVFLHYHTCRTVTLVGGTITVNVEAYTASGNASVREARTACPRPVTLKASGEVVIGGIVTRALGPPLTLPAQPSFVLAGPRAGSFTRARISREGTEALTVPLDGPRLRWPPGASPLTVGAVYELALLPEAPAAPVTVRFRVTTPLTDPAGPTLTVIRLE